MGNYIKCLNCKKKINIVIIGYHLIMNILKQKYIYLKGVGGS